jgi:hypothetical protein
MAVTRSIIAVLVQIPGLIFAQATIEPAAPKAQETIRLKVPRSMVSEYIQGSSVVTMANNRISASLRVSAVSLGIPSPPVDIVLGQLPVGTYDVEFTTKSETGVPIGTISMLQFAVTNPSHGNFFPAANYTDLWWDPAESGYGLSVTQHINDKLFAFWFVYGVDGKPIWYFVPDGSWTTSVVYAGAVYKTTGPYFGGPFNAANVVATPVGAATLSFTEYDRVTFNYTIDGVVGTKNLRRMGF